MLNVMATNPIIISVFFFLSLVGTLSAQSIEKGDSIAQSPSFIPVERMIGFELGGNAVFISLDFEQKLVNNLYIRVGIGLTISSGKFSDSSNPLVPMPPVAIIMSEYKIHVYKNLFLDVGLGSTILLIQKYRTDWLFAEKNYNSMFCLTGRFGIRFYPTGVTGSFMGFAATPFFDLKPFSVFKWYGIYFGGVL
jgi:hypothetical protein